MDDIDRIRDVIADVAAGLTPGQYGNLLLELIADSEGWKVQLDELITSGELPEPTDWPEDGDDL